MGQKLPDAAGDGAAGKPLRLGVNGFKGCGLDLLGGAHLRVDHLAAQHPAGYDALKIVFLPHAELLPDPLPPEMLQKYRLLPKAEAVCAIHCPATEEQAAAARRRLIYEELLVLQLGIGRMRSRGAAATGAPMRRADPAPFWQSLPFAPTGAQRRAVEEILNDMAGDTDMNRLLQGDVGSGKTLVAAAAIWACIRAGYQAALLAPTEILAAQHAEGQTRYTCRPLSISLSRKRYRSCRRLPVMHRVLTGVRPGGS